VAEAAEAMPRHEDYIREAGMTGVAVPAAA
jgi:hypothetical protein